MGCHFTKLVPSFWNLCKRWQREKYIHSIENLKHTGVHIFECICIWVASDTDFSLWHESQWNRVLFFYQVFNCFGTFLVEKALDPEEL